jgi:hypothetical protein
MRTSWTLFHVVLFVPLAGCAGRITGTTGDAGPYGDGGAPIDVGASDGSRDGFSQLDASMDASGCSGIWCTTYGASYTAQQQDDERYYLLAVWGSSPSDVWFVGQKVLHWNGSTFAEYSNQGDVLESVWGTGPNDVWAVGGENGGSTGAFHHWDGSSWTRKLGFQRLGSVWANTPDDAWAVGGTQPGALHWDGTDWTASTAPTLLYGGVWGSDSADVWLRSGSGAEHWDGSQWS